MTQDPPVLAARILEATQSLIQRRGYGGFALGDAAALAGVTEEDIERLFAGKGQLAAAVAAQYHRQYVELMETMLRTLEPVTCLRRYAEEFGRALNEERLCLCGVIAAEAASLPPEVAGFGQTIQSFHRQWLARVIERGQAAGIFLPSLNPEIEGLVLFATFEGAMMMARNEGKPDVFHLIAERALTRLIKPGAHVAA